ncbi:MAG: hypothetical protein GX427_05865 [Actinomycetales bacterium]|nr:hypothetical protein [Actinomycetales bacterium]
MITRDPLVVITLPVRDLERSRSFVESVGWSVDQGLSGDGALCAVISPHIRAMFVTDASFRAVTGRAVADPAVAGETVTCLVVESRFHVDHVVERALAAGAAEAGEPEDHGASYLRTFVDPDGHLWQVRWTADDAA